MDDGGRSSAGAIRPEGLLLLRTPAGEPARSRRSRVSLTIVPRLALLAATFAVLVSSGGCSTAIYYAASRAGHETPPQPHLGLTREKVDVELGKPIAVTALPDRGQIATYRYRQRDLKAKEGVGTSLGIHAAIGYLTRGYGWL